MALKQRVRATSVYEIMNTKFEGMGFEGEWLNLFGDPELTGCWIIWGESANGKTQFAMQLAKYMTNFATVLYNSLEEGVSKSLAEAVVRTNMRQCTGRFIILDKEPIEELEIRLQKKKSPNIIFIDSVQYTGLNKITAKSLVDRYPKKLFVFISHANGKFPDGRVANAIRYHANVKIIVQGYRAKIQSRFGGDKSKFYTVWEEGASDFWD